MKPRFVFLCLLPLLFLIVVGRQPSAAWMDQAAGPPPVPLPVWRGETAAPGIALTGQGVPGMALDPDGRPHLVYGFNRLFHAWHDGAAWQVETVDVAGDVGGGPVIAIDDAGVITIVATTAASSQRDELAVYSRAPGGAWQTARISVPWIAEYPVLALALDNNGRPHVLTTGGIADQIPLLIYAHTSAQGWVSETLELERYALGELSLALDSHDQPVILYEIDDEIDDGLGLGKILHLARRGADGWTDETIAHAEFIAGKSLALDAADRAHVVYNDLYASRLVYLRQTGNGWQTLAESGDSYAPSLALDATGRPHVAFTNGDEDLVYAVLGNDGWEQTTIPMVGHGGGHNTLLLDGTGAAHISTMQIQQNLYYATNRGGPWAAMPVAVQDVVGEKHALALDTADRPHLLYYHQSLGQLRWAGRDGGAWATSAVAEVDDSPLRPLELAVAFGPNDVAQIAYVDGAANELVFGTRQGDGWLLAPITTAGSNLALTVGPDNRPHLILIQDNRLAYWAQEAGTWQREWISAAGEALFNAFLALDDQNRPHVVYTAEGEAIEAVRQGQDDWQMEALPVDYMIGMALGPEGSLHLLTVTSRSEGSRPPFTFYTLWLSERVAGEWTQRALFEDAYDLNALSTTRLLVEPDRTLHVVSPHSFDLLRYLRREADGQWSSDSIAGPGGSFALAVGSDGQPRVSRHENTDLRLYTREILSLDKHMLLPVVPIKSPW